MSPLASKLYNAKWVKLLTVLHNLLLASVESSLLDIGKLVDTSVEAEKKHWKYIFKIATFNLEGCISC